jgi:hypothetical protein
MNHPHRIVRFEAIHKGMAIMLTDLCTDYNSPNTWTFFESYLSFVSAIQCGVPLGILNIHVDKPRLR